MAIEFGGQLHCPEVRDTREKAVAVAGGRDDEPGANTGTVDMDSGNRWGLTKPEGRGALSGQLVM